MVIIVTMCKLLFAAAVGFYMAKKNVITEEVSKSMSSLVLNVTSPALMLVSVSYVENGSDETVLKLMIAGVIVYTVLSVAGRFIALLIRAPKGQIGVYTCMIIFANTSFIGYPVVQSLYGDDSIFYDTMFHFPFCLFLYTLGIYLIAKDAGKTTKFEAKYLLSSGFVGSALAVVLYFTHWQLPAILSEPLSFVGSLTSPLSLVVLGSNVSRYSLKELFGDKRLYVFSVIRLIILPLLTAVALYGVFADKRIVAICAMTMGMPAAAAVVMAGCQYKETTDISSIGVAFTTILFVVTMPLLAIILKIGLGV